MKLRRITHLAAPLAFAAMFFVARTEVHAQTHAPTQIQPAHSEPAHGAAPAGKHEAAEGQHGTPVTLFGMHLNDAGKFAVQVVNFAIFFAILYFILKGALSSAFKARAKELEEQLAQAEKDRAEGEAQLRDLETRMAGMQTELAEIMAKARSDAESEKQRILEAARSEASVIQTQTQAEIEFQKRLAEKELRALVAELAVEGAAKRLESMVQGPTAERVLDQAIQHVGGAK